MREIIIYKIHIFRLIFITYFSTLLSDFFFRKHPDSFLDFYISANQEWLYKILIIGCQNRENWTEILNSQGNDYFILILDFIFMISEYIIYFSYILECFIVDIENPFWVFLEYILKHWII